MNTRLPISVITKTKNIGRRWITGSLKNELYNINKFQHIDIDTSKPYILQVR